MSCDFGEVSKILLWDTNSSLMYLAILPNSSGSCEVYGGQSGRGTEFSPNTSVSPVSIIPPLLHTHPSIYHPRCTMFFSQHFSFPCHNHSINALYVPSSTSLTRKTDWRNLGTCQKQCSYENWVEFNRHIFPIFQSLKR